MRTTRAARSQDDLNGNLPGPVAGIDIGGTKIATLIVDAAGAVLGRATHASSVGDQGGAVASIAACLDEALGGAALRRSDLKAVGVGVPGRVDPKRGHVTLLGACALLLTRELGLTVHR